jgi:hypothetical protein
MRQDDADIEAESWGMHLMEYQDKLERISKAVKRMKRNKEITEAGYKELMGIINGE